MNVSISEPISSTIVVVDIKQKLLMACNIKKKTINKNVEKL